MLIDLRHQLHRLLRQRRGSLLLMLLAAMALALPVSATTQVHSHSDSTALQQSDSHCSHHTQADTGDHGAAHHGSEHSCHCAQACHANPVALIAMALNLPPLAQAAQSPERPQPLITTVHTPLYRPPITLAA